MDEKSLRIIYMGTPEFAVSPLKRLLDEHYNIVGVVTAPDKPAGRGKKIKYSAVKQFALDHDIRLFQPEKLKNETFLDDLKSLNPDLQIVVAFRMLPELVWTIPSLGTFNLHASLLPDYRGAAPINWAIINGETETGLTTFLIDKHIDTGNILLQKRVAISESENAGSLHDRLMIEGAGLVLDTIGRLADGSITPIPQESLTKKRIEVKQAPKISKEDCRIIWGQEGKKIRDFIRGLSPYPGAYSHLVIDGSDEVLFKIYESSFKTELHKVQPGTISTDQKTYLHIAAKDGWISIHKIQQAGKRPMPVDQFLRGFTFKISSDRFS